MYPKNNLSYVGNFMHMMWGPLRKIEVDPIIESALNKPSSCTPTTSKTAPRPPCVWWAPHKPTSTAVSAGVSALGTSHGGANQAVIEMLEAIRAEGSPLQSWIDRAKDKTDSSLMGFDRVYKNFDPRARIIKKAADEVFASWASTIRSSTLQQWKKWP